MIQEEKDRLECLRLAVNLCISMKLSREQVGGSVTELAEKFHSYIRSRADADNRRTRNA